MSVECTVDREPLVSIIVPVYNSERYLSTLLDSLLNQTYRNLEVICINDGSKDTSLQILKDYSSQDARVVVVDKENSGAATTRNVGLDRATGEFLCFVDSDDYVIPTAISVSLALRLSMIPMPSSSIWIISTMPRERRLLRTLWSKSSFHLELYFS